MAPVLLLLLTISIIIQVDFIVRGEIARTVWYYHTSYSIIQCMQRSDEENIIHPGAEDLSFVLAHLQSKK
jgi:hypothetical protein